VLDALDVLQVELLAAQRSESCIEANICHSRLRASARLLRSRRLLTARLQDTVLQAVRQGPTLHCVLPPHTHVLLDSRDIETQGAADHIYRVHTWVGLRERSRAGTVAGEL
jgi:hypothetical protein